MDPQSLPRDQLFQRFDAVSLPTLEGMHLVEAGAGTGKTFNITLILLRLLVERELELRRVLVVTFTEAATEELRARIRERLVEARDLADALAAGKPATALPAGPLSELFQRWLRDHDPETLQRRLALAVLSVDELAVHTIHGFCQRALRDHAFGCGGLFDRGEIVSDRELLKTLCKDYWREHLLELGPDESAWLARCLVGSGKRLSGPEHLAAAIEPLVTRLPAQRLGAPEPGELARLETRLRELHAQTAAAFAEPEALLDAFSGPEQLNQRSYPWAEHAPRLHGIGAWLQSGELWREPPEKADKYTAAALAKGTRKGAQAPLHPAFHLLGELLVLRERVAPLKRAQLLVDAASFVQEQMRAHKLRLHAYSYDDMIAVLAEAVEHPEYGRRLRSALHASHPYALVDEFQDTDPLQYRIFRRIYAGRTDGGLMMIGDPKQAIYSFRGGDVFAYMGAVGEAEQRHTLIHNWRSSPCYIHALNSVFRHAEPRPFLYDRIPYRPARTPPAVRKPQLLVGGRPIAPLTFWHVGSAEGKGKIAKTGAVPRILRACAGEIAALLRRARAGDAVYSDSGKALAPGDIAVLVRTNRQARDVQLALREWGVPSVCLRKDTVFATPAAMELLTLLAAVHAPERETLVRNALAGGLFGHGAAELAALFGDDRRWDETLQRFRAYRDTWERHGVLAMLQAILTTAAPRLLGLPDGARQMTDYLHLGELLQQASAQNFGQGGLLRWLTQQIRNSAGGETDSEELQLRLETDEDLVQVLTMHKSKGLEYPVVFAPFLWEAPEPTQLPGRIIKCHDDHDDLLLDLGSAAREANAQREAQEQLGEHLRLAYVTLTRAVHACFVPWGHLNGAGRSALAWLLHQRQGCTLETYSEAGFSGFKAMDESAVRAGLEALAQGHILVADLPEPEAFEPLPTAASTTEELAPRTLRTAVRDPWWTYSYSQLAGHSRASLTALAQEEAETEVLVHTPGVPRGAAFGSCVHRILELMDLRAASSEASAELIRRECRAAGFDAAADYVHDLVRSCVGTPLALVGTAPFALCELAPGEHLPELEFHFPLAGTDTDALATCLDRHGYPQPGAALAVRGRQWLGMMTGKIDLVLRRDARYFLVDYKTHDLGTAPGAYAEASLRRVASAEQLDLQYLIYTVALHRYLSGRVAGYDYDRHFGGALYLFLRGLCAESRDGQLFVRPPRRLIEELDALLDGREAKG